MIVHPCPGSSGVEQWIENPRVGGSIPPPGTILRNKISNLAIAHFYEMRCTLIAQFCCVFEWVICCVEHSVCGYCVQHSDCAHCLTTQCWQKLVAHTVTNQQSRSLRPLLRQHVAVCPMAA